MTLRRAAVAGSFYPSDPTELKRSITDSYLHRIGPGKLPPIEEVKGIISCVCPHAGYIYSGPVAAYSYLQVSSLRKPALVVIIAPNHYGIGSGISTFREGEWETPLGRVKIDSDAARKIVDLTGIVDYDPLAHSVEHSLEVQLPFLQCIYDSFTFLPVSISFQDIKTAKELGTGIAELLKGMDAILIASSDLTHYEPATSAREKDLALLKKVEELDLHGFYTTLQQRHISACGYGAIAAVMEASRLLGFTRGNVLKYATSGETTGEMNSVVGYPSLKFVK
jgi:AmmeMemoRadiSam system protein B